jgi:uncharacterized protein YukE
MGVDKNMEGKELLNIANKKILWVDRKTDLIKLIIDFDPNIIVEEISPRLDLIQQKSIPVSIPEEAMAKFQSELAGLKAQITKVKTALRTERDTLKRKLLEIKEQELDWEYLEKLELEDLINTKWLTGGQTTPVSVPEGVLREYQSEIAELKAQITKVKTALRTERDTLKRKLLEIKEQELDWEYLEKLELEEIVITKWLAKGLIGVIASHEGFKGDNSETRVLYVGKQFRKNALIRELTTALGLKFNLVPAKKLTPVSA